MNPLVSASGLEASSAGCGSRFTCHDGQMAERDRDESGRPRSTRPRDALGPQRQAAPARHPGRRCGSQRRVNATISSTPSPCLSRRVSGSPSCWACAGSTSRRYGDADCHRKGHQSGGPGADADRRDEDGRRPKDSSAARFRRTVLTARRGVPYFGEQTMIFPSTAGTWRDPDNFRARWREVRQDLGVPDATSHSFRKTVATLIDDEGLSARIGADHLGHSRISMTQDKYMARGRVHTAVADLLDRTINDE